MRRASALLAAATTDATLPCARLVSCYPRISSYMTSLLLVPLEDTVVFPTMDVTLSVDVADEERVLLVPRHESDFAKVGTIATVADRVRRPGGGRAVTLSGEMRGI